MSSIERFEDILAWQKSKYLAVLVYGSMKDSRDFSFRDQIQRAAVSVSNNIAEGFERGSNKEFKHFLFIAKGSCGEVRSMSNVGFELNILNPQQSLSIRELSTGVSKIISGLIKKL